MLAGACGKPKPTKEPRLLVIDGIEITFAELKPHFDWMGKHDPNAGERTRYIHAMREYVLPLRIAERAFPEQRAQKLAEAQGLCDVASNIEELEQHTELVTDKLRSNLTRTSAQLPVAQYLFVEHELNNRRVSPPIAVPQGYFVVASYSVETSPLLLADYADALQVGFVTHSAKEWRDWWEAEKLRLGKLVTFVHPDYRDDLPSWMQLPAEKNS